MTPSVLSTRSLDPRDQFDAWRTWFSPVFDISRTRDERCFIAENKVWDLGGLLVSRVSAPSVRVLRARSNLRRAPIDHWVLSYCRHGSTGIRTKASSLLASSGVPYLWSFGDESESERTEVDRIQILLPRDTHGEMASVLDASTGSVLNSAWGRLLGEYIMLLDRWLPHLDAGELPPMTAAVRSMVFACVAPSADRIALANGEIGRVNLERARQAVRGNLKSPSLSPSSLGAIVGISRSALYRLFEHIGGVGQYIQQQRLLAAYSALSDPANRQSIQSVSASFCFKDASTFSRAFKREFGQSPSDVRAAAASGIPGSPRSRMRENPRGERFIDAVR